MMSKFTHTTEFERTNLQSRCRICKETIFLATTPENEEGSRWFHDHVKPTALCAGGQTYATP